MVLRINFTNSHYTGRSYYSQNHPIFIKLKTKTAPEENISYTVYILKSLCSFHELDVKLLETTCASTVIPSDFGVYHTDSNLHHHFQNFEYLLTNMFFHFTMNNIKFLFIV